MDKLFICGIVFTSVFSVLIGMTVVLIKKKEISFKAGVILSCILAIVGPILLLISGVQEISFDDCVETECQRIVEKFENPFKESELKSIEFYINESNMINSDRCKVNITWKFTADHYGKNFGWSMMQSSLKDYIEDNFTHNINGVVYSVGDVRHTVLINGKDYLKENDKPCAESGCTRNREISGDTIYCWYHSNKCMGCGCYIDKDALYCLSCIEDALK